MADDEVGVEGDAYEEAVAALRGVKWEMRAARVYSCRPA
jgi:hypothetical protein